VTRARLPLGEILDDAGETVAAVAFPWAGVLWLTAIPLRLAQAHFAARLFELGKGAPSYGDHLRHLALLVSLTLLVSLAGRAVFVRACGLRLRGIETRGGEWRVPAAGFASYVYAALAIEAAFYATWVAVVTVPFLILVAGLAAATFPLVDRPGLTRPFAVIAAHATRVGPLLGLLAVFAVAALLAAANLYVVFALGRWAAGAFTGFDATRWEGLLALSNRRFLFVLLAGGALAVEPWWLASLVVYVHKLQSRSSGEDLRLWFERLRGAEGAG
jgi:hypothetical protein